MKHIDARSYEQQFSLNGNQWAAPALQLVSAFNQAANTDEIGESPTDGRDDHSRDECSSLEDILQIIIDRGA